MKKLLLIITVLTACTFTASAQRARSSSSSFFSTEKADAPITFGIRGGLNLAYMKVKEGHVSNTGDTRTSFNAGVSVDIPLLQSIYLQSGLYYTSKGTKYKDDDWKETSSANYLEIPVLASYRYDFGDAAQLQFNVGPYFAYGIGGKYKEEEGDEEYSSDFFDEDTKKFDMGLQVGGGVTISKHYYIGAAFEWGFTNLWKDADDESLKTRNFMINIGYTF
jgi:hypothetical protein